MATCPFCEAEFPQRHRAECIFLHQAKFQAQGLPQIGDLDHYQVWFGQQCRMYGAYDLPYLASKAMIEAGEAADVLAKIKRDIIGEDCTAAQFLPNVSGAQLDHYLAELSDQLWYILMQARAVKVPASRLLEIQRLKIISRQARGTEHGSGSNR